jgi:hypothetical protein
MMKMVRSIVTVLFLTICLAASAIAEGAGSHAGRILDYGSGKADFIVNSDHTVTVVFYDEAMNKQLAAEKQVVTVIAEAPGGKTTLPLAVRDGKMISEGKLPPGHGYNLVVQIKADSNAKPKNFRVPFDLSTCAECGKAEYACTCHD